MPIENLIVHEVHKDDETGKFTAKYRTTENEINEKAEALLVRVNKLFRSAGLATGKFTLDEDGTKPIFERNLETGLSGYKFSDFLAFSKFSADQLVKNLQGTSAHGGYLLFLKYTYDSKNYLTVMLIRKTTEPTIDPDSLDLKDIEIIDLAHLHLAAKISLNDWKGAKDKYISFKKGQGTKDVRHYFQRYIGCEEFLNVIDDTRALVKVVGVFCEKKQLDAASASVIQAKVHGQCVEWASNDQNISVSKLSEIIDSSLQYEGEDAGLFLEIAQSETYMLSDELRVDKKYLSPLLKYSVKVDGLKLEIDREWFTKNVEYKKEAGTLVISNIPKDQLNQFE